MTACNFLKLTSLFPIRLSVSLTVFLIVSFSE